MPRLSIERYSAPVIVSASFSAARHDLLLYPRRLPLRVRSSRHRDVFAAFARRDRALHAFDLGSEDDAVLTPMRQGDLGELVDGVCAGKQAAFSAKRVSGNRGDDTQVDARNVGRAVHASRRDDDRIGLR